MPRTLTLAAAAAAALVAPAATLAQPLEAFVRRPEIADAALSPDGARLAIVGNNADGDPYVLVRELGGGSNGFKLENDYKVYSVDWIGERYLITIVGFNDELTFSRTGTLFTDDVKFEVQKPLVIDTEDMSARDGTERLRRNLGFNTALSDIVGIDHDGGRFFLAAFDDSGEYSLFAIDAANLRGQMVGDGDDDTWDWVIGEDWRAAARLDYDSRSDRLMIYSYASGSPSPIFDERAPVPNQEIVGLDADGEALVVRARTATEGLYRVGLQGGALEPWLVRSDYDIGRVVRDPYTNRVVAARYADDVWRTHWFDPDLERMERALQQAFGERHAVLFSWDRTRSKVLIEVEGADTSSEFYLFDAERGQAQPIGVAYPELAPFGLLARREPIAYPARDGTMIPGYLTTPPGVAGPAPLVVLPHGGPESRDYGGFDWIAHFLASRGYRVLQPNFRGSDGYGTAFRNAGRGEWGGLMQDDVTDGVRYMIDEGLADPERVCIVGLSYGGYAALAGAVGTPELYDCVVAVAPVTDLPAMIRWAKDRYGRLSWIVDYWSQVIGGDVSEDDARIVAASLTGRADAVAAPILLIHGVDDTTVPIDQSERMEAALRRAGKDVAFIRLRGEDHYLYRPDTRLEAMQAMEAFLAEHLGGE